MKETPTSGPMAKSSTHHARDTTSSRKSLLRSQTVPQAFLPVFLVRRNTGKNACPTVLRERKEHLFETCVRVSPSQRFKLLQRSFAADASAAAIVSCCSAAGRIADLVDREKQRPPASRMRAQC